MKRQNKTLNRFVAVGLILAILATIGIGAYLTSTDVKEDVYTVGNVQAEIVSSGDMEIGNVGALLPGTVHRYERAAMNTGINDAYVFMSITIPYEMIGVADSDGTQLGEKTMQLFIPGSADGYVSSEWKLVDSGFIGEYEIEENEQLNGEHEQYSTVVGNTITYVYGYIGDNADGSLKALASGETTANLVESMELRNLYRADNITGSVSTKLYAIQSNNVNGGLTDVNGVWAVINHALVGNEVADDEVQTANALMVGELFNAYIPDDVSSVEFVAMPQTYGLRSATAPADAIDVSAAQDGSVMAWAEDGVFYVAAMNGEKIIANKNSDKMFYNKSNLTYINTENLDMSQVESAAYMFKNCANLTNSANDFNLANVKNIEQTFYGCNWLTEYTVPNSVEVIGEAAFANCFNLAKISIPNSVKVIDGWVFQQCFALTSIEIPDSVEALGQQAFSWSGLTEVTIPASIEAMSSLAFSSCESLGSVVFEDGIKDVGVTTFYDCVNLTSVQIPASVEKIGDNVFYNCTNLTSVIIAENSDLNYIGDYAFFNTGLISITIPNKVTHIGVEAFACCTSLTSATFEEGSQLKSIGEGAFAICSWLTEITIPKGVISIGDGAFGANNRLANINVDPANEYYTSVDGVLFSKDTKTLVQYPGGKADAECIIPDYVEIIAVQAVEGEFDYVSIPASVKNIDSSAFVNCFTFAINVDPANEYYTSVDGVLFTKDMKTLIKYPIHKTNTEYTVPNGVETIEMHAFANCQNLTSVNVSASVKAINKEAFSNCQNLTTIMFEEGSQLETIGDRAFEMCFNLTSINFPSSVAYIGFDAFATYDYNGYIPWFINELYSHYYNNKLFVIGNVLVDASVASGEFVIPSGITQIYEYACYGNTNITSIVIPTSVKRVDDQAFRDAMIGTIYYCGTEEQWNAIDFGYSWDYGLLEDYTVSFNYVPAN